jgi:regulatory protein
VLAIPGIVKHFFFLDRCRIWGSGGTLTYAAGAGVRDNRGLKRKKLLDVAALWDYALKSAGARAQSTGEMRSKLRQRAERPEDVETTIEKLKEYGFLNDQRYAENFASARLENDGFGKQRALRDLAQKRVAPAVAEGAVQQVYTGQDETALIEAFIRRRYRNADREKLFQQDKDLASAFRRLRVAGFQTGSIIKVLRRFAAKPELLDAAELPDELDL